MRIPVAFEWPGGTALLHRDGNRPEIEPMRRSGLLALLATLDPIDEN